jgi:hypothetical protein
MKGTLYKKLSANLPKRMKKYILMIVGLVGVSVLGGAGVVYSLINSAPMHVSRIELRSPAGDGIAAQAEGGVASRDTRTTSIIVH